ncbi:transposable element tc3 transposase [Caerostris extrusa]|uniref:Transposable element tc3 transposase n=1 Tax=Caerostris extrusa TaxID=172846 RepID=A0AAV4NMD5_CAEEX|nr:transposable element tc3 transposase [Caerostris extrusa]
MRDSKGPITSSALKKVMKKFEATGSLASRQRSGHLTTAAAVATTVEQTVQSMSAVAAHGECSAREVSRQTGVSYGSVWKALRITLKWYPYKLQHKQELKPPDFDSRRGFANLEARLRNIRVVLDPYKTLNADLHLDAFHYKDDMISLHPSVFI